MNYGITPPNIIDTSEQEAKLEEHLAAAASELRYNSPEIVVAELLQDNRLYVALSEPVATGGCLGLLELIDDIARKLVIDGKSDGL